ncbi:MAG: hypothetical protein PHC51_03785 [bacterium]|nr:hypothetical protein [bacterium]
MKSINDSIVRKAIVWVVNAINQNGVKVCLVLMAFHLVFGITLMRTNQLNLSEYYQKYYLGYAFFGTLLLPLALCWLYKHLMSFLSLPLAKFLVQGNDCKIDILAIGKLGNVSESCSVADIFYCARLVIKSGGKELIIFDKLLSLETDIAVAGVGNSCANLSLVQDAVRAVVAELEKGAPGKIGRVLLSP